MKVWVLALGLACLIAGVNQAKADSDMTVPMVVPFTMQGHVPTVSAQLNGQPIRLAIDLGGYSSLAVRTAALGKMAVAFDGHVDRWKDAEGTEHASRTFSIDELRAGDFMATHVDSSELVTPIVGGQDGYIGFGLLQRYVMVFDYMKGELRLYGHTATDMLKIECGANIFPIDVINGVVQAKIPTDRGVFIFQLDTGASENVFRPSALGDAASSFKGITSIPFSRFTIGSRDFGRTRIPLREFNAPDVDGVLGSDFLDRKLLCLDPQGHRAAIKE